MIHHIGSVTQDHIVERIKDWKARLNDLGRIIEGWANKIEGATVRRTEIPQAREELMQRYGVDPQYLPAVAVLQGSHRVSFVPLGLWVIGANGRVNITTNHHNYILIDGAEFQSPPDWIIVDPFLRNKRMPLSEDALRRLAKDEDPFA